MDSGHILGSMHKPINQQAREYHEALPGIIKAMLNDAGITNEVIEKRGAL